MARTVDQHAHATRRDEILDAAQRLLGSTGYDRMSIQDVLGELGISKGALYHYFPSKQDLLAGLVERTADTVRERLAPVAEDRERDAITKLNGLFERLADWKAQHRDELVAMLRVWHSDDNALLRQRTRAGITDRVAPLLATIVEQGVREGVFAVPAPGEFGRVLMALIHDVNERLGELFFAYESGLAELGAVERTVTSYTSALERMLGLAEGSARLVDLPSLFAWFDPRYYGEGSPS